MGEVVLGVVASGFAVASLAIQLVEVSQKLHAFWESIADAGSTVERIKDHILVMQIISSSIIDICKDEPRLACGDAVLKCLQSCKSRASKLETLLYGKDPCSEPRGKKRKWSSLRLALKEKTIEKIESQLKGDVMMLLLTLQPFYHHIHCHDIFSIKETVAGLSTLPNSPNSTDEEEAQSNMNSSSKSPQILKKRTKPVSKALNRNRRLELSSRLQSHRSSLKLDSITMIEKGFSALGLSISPTWRGVFQYYVFGIMYTSSRSRLYHDPEQSLLINIKRRLRVMLPILSFQIQTSSLPKRITSYPIVPCQSQVFTLCVDGNLETVRILFETSRASPFAMNQHGENLLHAAARYAHAELCSYLLNIGVDGSAYDDRLLTPLDHLARKVCMSFAYPSRVVNTIRALVEKGRCQPLLPLTSNAVSFYRGPEEGFAWLFASEYAGVDLEECDSEGWTLLGDAALNFGWWTQIGAGDPAVGWQTLYLLRAGANPHATSSEGELTPLDAFLRGCTRHQVENGRTWLQILLQSGIDLHKYADQEQSIHGHEQYLKARWDEELWRWIPTKRRVVYEYGHASDQLEIWIEDFDALGWFQCGRYDLDIFQVCTPAESLLRWREIDSRSDFLAIDEQDNLLEPMPATQQPLQNSLQVLFQARWFQFLCISLALNYFLHLMIIRNQ